MSHKFQLYSKNMNDRQNSYPFTKCLTLFACPQQLYKPSQYIKSSIPILGRYWVGDSQTFLHKATAKVRNNSLIWQRKEIMEIYTFCRGTPVSSGITPYFYSGFILDSAWRIIHLGNRVWCQNWTSIYHMQANDLPTILSFKLIDPYFWSYISKDRLFWYSCWCALTSNYHLN